VETDKEKQEKSWIATKWYATKTEVDAKDFEESRRCLLNSYHSYVQTHAGHIVGLILGLAAVFSTLEDSGGFT
jgi:hypothetical protein